MVPVYIATCLLVVQVLLAIMRRVWKGEAIERIPNTSRESFFRETIQQLKALGPTSMTLRILRLFATLTLTVITIVAFVSFQNEGNSETDVPTEGLSRAYIILRTQTGAKWIEAVYIALYVSSGYMRALSLFTMLGLFLRTCFP
jgi:hypothetical protein